MFNLKFILLLFVFQTVGWLSAQTLDIRIKNINEQDGQLCVAVFENENSFKTEKPLISAFYPKSHVVNGEYRLKIPIAKSGLYGVSVLDDKNKNGKMEYNFLGIPREGFGFSDFYVKGFRSPHFCDFCFYIEKNETKEISVVMKYM